MVTRRWLASSSAVLLGIALSGGCGSSASEEPGVVGTEDGGQPALEAGCAADEVLCQGACTKVSKTDAVCGAGACAKKCTSGTHCVDGTECRATKIEHVVLVVQENHTFDTYFGKYCQAPAGSNPTCTSGRACCEAAPAKEPKGASPIKLDDAANFSGDRDHDQACEVQQIHDGAMDGFVTGSTGRAACLGPQCANAANWALADGAAPGDTVSFYWTLADQSALADRYFQPIAGGTASNDMYLAGAHFRFVDNANIPDVSVGTDFANKRSINKGGLCVDPVGCISSNRTTYKTPTIAGLLLDARRTFGIYADGYAVASAAAIGSQSCASPTTPSNCKYSDCVAHPEGCFGCLYDPSDVPFLYYDRFQDTVSGSSRIPTPYAKDYDELAKDIASGALPEFVYVKARVWRNEHPNLSTITDGEAFVSEIVNRIGSSLAYKDNTLVLLTWDEGGGFFDHVAPPASPPITVDADDAGKPVPYGTRVPMLALGPFARKGTVTHVVMEHSSIVKFLEWNFLTDTGQLGARDGWVANLGSLLDPAATGVAVPEN